MDDETVSYGRKNMYGDTKRFVKRLRDCGKPTEC